MSNIFSNQNIYGDLVVGTGSTTHLSVLTDGNIEIGFSGSNKMSIQLNNSVHSETSSVDSKLSVGFGGYNTIKNSNYTSILGGFRNIVTGTTTPYLNTSYSSAILTGHYNQITDSDNSVIGGGVGNRLSYYATRSFIGAGSNNYIANIATQSAIVAGGSSHIKDGSDGAFIGAGNSNYIEYYSSNASIVGGLSNEIYSSYKSFIGGGQSNTIRNYSNMSTIGGGKENNILSSYYGSVNGGLDNDITSSYYGSIGGGLLNKINQSTGGSIGGGNGNHIYNLSSFSVVGGGRGSLINSSVYSGILAGFNNQILSTGHYSFIGGGKYNTINTSQRSSIVGGQYNHINSSFGFIGGGKYNNILSSGIYSSILGGRYNYNIGGFANTHIIGSNIYANKSNFTFVNSLDIYTTPQSGDTATDGILVRATDGEVKIVTSDILSKTLIYAYGIPNTEKLKLEDVNNWTINGSYTGTTITNTYQGQKWYDNDYFFEAVGDNDFIRLPRA